MVIHVVRVVGMILGAMSVRAVVAMGVVAVVPVAPFGVMVCQEVVAPLGVEVAPDGVDVVGTILGVVVLDEEPWSLKAVVVGITDMFTTGPTEVDVTGAVPGDAVQLVVGEGFGHAPGIGLDECVQQMLLILGH